MAGRSVASLRVSSKHRRRPVQKPVRKVRQLGELERARAAKGAEYLAAVRDFEAAVRYFHKESFRKAADIFEKLVSSSVVEIADRSRMHLRLCEQRLSAEAPAARTAEEHYLLGVAALNSRQLNLAVEHLSKAAKLKPNREHVHYALAAARALQGESGLALRHLQSAVELQPENRARARNDEDFQSLTDEPRFRELVTSRTQ